MTWSVNKTRDAEPESRMKFRGLYAVIHDVGTYHEDRIVGIDEGGNFYNWGALAGE